MAVKRDLATSAVALSSRPENPLGLRVQDTVGDELGHRTTGLEGRVQREPRLRPQQAVLDLHLDLASDVLVTDVQEPGHKGLIVPQHLLQHTERVHTSPSASSCPRAELNRVYPLPAGARPVDPSTRLWRPLFASAPIALRRGCVLARWHPACRAPAMACFVHPVARVDVEVVHSIRRGRTHRASRQAV